MTAAARLCALPGCENPVRASSGQQAKYCSPAHAEAAGALRAKAKKQAARGARGGAARAAAYRARRPRTEWEQRQQPVRPVRPVFRLTLDPSVRILPALAAPLQLYEDGHDAGRPMPYQDDLRAINDRGSPDRVMDAQPAGWARMSVLA